MEEEFDQTTMDARVIAAGQRAEHYEMAAYGGYGAVDETFVDSFSFASRAELQDAGGPAVDGCVPHLSRVAEMIAT